MQRKNEETMMDGSGSMLIPRLRVAGFWATRSPESLKRGPTEWELGGVALGWLPKRT
jgi:hypothetical protein